MPLQINNLNNSFWFNWKWWFYTCDTKTNLLQMVCIVQNVVALFAFFSFVLVIFFLLFFQCFQQTATLKWIQAHEIMCKYQQDLLFIFFLENNRINLLMGKQKWMAFIWSISHVDHVSHPFACWQCITHKIFVVNSTDNLHSRYSQFSRLMETTNLATQWCSHIAREAGIKPFKVNIWINSLVGLVCNGCNVLWSIFSNRPIIRFQFSKRQKQIPSKNESEDK